MERVIWIINQYASHLETRHLELAKVFNQYGYKTVIITSSFHHGQHKYLFKEEFNLEKKSAGVYFAYIKSKPEYFNNGGKRIINMINFCKEVYKHADKLESDIGKPSFIIGSSAHPFVWEISYKLSKKNNAKFIAEFRDIWPLALIDIQGISPKHPFVKLLEVIEKRAYKHADVIVSTMPYAWKHVIHVVDVKHEKIHWMPNGINVSEIEKNMHSKLPLPEDLEHYLDEHWCCIYIGSIVKSENIEFLIRSFARVQNEDIWFAVVGEGNEKERMQVLAEQLRLNRIRFFPHVDRDIIPRVLEKSKVAVAASQDSPIAKYGFSKYKLNDYLLAGIPTVFSCNQHTVVDEAGHFSVPCGDEKKMAEAIMTIKGLNEETLRELECKAKLLIQNEYDYGKIGEKYIHLLESL